jgi:hypothetical protein
MNLNPYFYFLWDPMSSAAINCSALYIIYKDKFDSNFLKKVILYNFSCFSFLGIYVQTIPNILNIFLGSHEPNLFYKAIRISLISLPGLFLVNYLRFRRLSIEKKSEYSEISPSQSNSSNQIWGFFLTSIRGLLFILFLSVQAYINYTESSINSDVLLKVIYFCTCAFLILVLFLILLSKSELGEKGINGKYFLIKWEDINAYSFSSDEKGSHILYINHKAIWPVGRPMNFSVSATEKDKIRELLEANVNVQMPSPE